MRQHLIAEGSEREVDGLRAVSCRGIARYLARQRAVLGDPFVAAAIQDAAVPMAVELEEPEGSGGVSVGVVAVEDHGRLGRDPARRQERLERLAGYEIADALALEVG